MERRGKRPRTPIATTVWRTIAGALVLASLAGCSSVPDAVNPVEWYKGTRDAIMGKDEPVGEHAEAPPGADGAIPNLSSVPERPRTSTSADRANVASSLIADQQGARRYSSDVIPRQGDLPQPPPPPRPNAAPTAQQQSSAPPRAAAPSSAAAPSAAQVQAAVPPPPPTATQVVPAARPAAPPVAAAEAPRAAPPGAARTPPQMREVTASNISPGSAQPIQPSNIVVPRENPQAPQMKPVTPYVSPAGMDQQETVYIGGSGSSGGGRATPASFRSLPSASSVAAEVPGTRPLSSFSAANARGSYQVAAIQFGDGSAKLSDRDRAVLRGVSAEHRKVGGTLRIVGHASSRTGANNVERHRDVNMKVSAERAEAVAHELVRLGVRADQMYVGAFSDADPRYFEFMPTGEAGNRRAEIFIDF